MVEDIHYLVRTYWGYVSTRDIDIGDVEVITCDPRLLKFQDNPPQILKIFPSLETDCNGNDWVRMNVIPSTWIGFELSG